MAILLSDKLDLNGINITSIAESTQPLKIIMVTYKHMSAISGANFPIEVPKYQRMSQEGQKFGNATHLQISVLEMAAAVC